MSTMQNYRTSRAPCGNQRCCDKPPDGRIAGKGRSLDRIEVKRTLSEEEAAQAEPAVDNDDIDWEDHTYLMDGPPFVYSTETPRG